MVLTLFILVLSLTIPPVQLYQIDRSIKKENPTQSEISSYLNNTQMSRQIHNMIAKSPSNHSNPRLDTPYEDESRSSRIYIGIKDEKSFTWLKQVLDPHIVFNAINIAIVDSSQLRLVQRHFQPYIIGSDQSIHQNFLLDGTDDIDDTTMTTTDITNQQNELLADGLKENYTGNNLKIGIIDNGVDNTSASLSHLEIIQRDFNQVNNITYDKGVMDHGTPVASALVGIDPNTNHSFGIATNVTLFSARMGTTGGSSIVGDFLGAFDWLVKNNVSIINTSFSGSSRMFEYFTSKFGDQILFIGSAGNAGKKKTSSGPADHELAFSIGSYKITDGQRILSDFSSHGPSYNLQRKPDFVAMGEDVISYFESVNKYSGTSFSAPLFGSALIAFVDFLRVNNISYTSSAIKAHLIEHSTNEFNYKHGYGRVNFTAAFKSAQDTGLIGLHASRDKITPEAETNYLKGSSEQIRGVIYNTSSVNFSVEGNASKLLQSSTLTCKTCIPFKITTTINESLSFGSYIGNLTILQDDNVSIKLPISISMEQKIKAVIDYNLYYTHQYYRPFTGITGGPWNRDRMIGGGNGLILEDLKARGYLINTTFSPFTGTSSPLVWLPGFMSILITSAIPPYLQLTDTEINAIESYVSSGGSLLLDGSSIIKNFPGGSYTRHSTDPSINQFLRRFDVSLPTSYESDISNRYSDTIGVSNATTVGKTTAVTGWGGYINYNTSDHNQYPLLYDEYDYRGILKNYGDGMVAVLTSYDMFRSCYYNITESNNRSYIDCKTSARYPDAQYQFSHTLIDHLVYAPSYQITSFNRQYGNITFDRNMSFIVSSSGEEVLTAIDDRIPVSELSDGRYTLIVRGRSNINYQDEKPLTQHSTDEYYYRTRFSRDTSAPDISVEDTNITRDQQIKVFIKDLHAFNHSIKLSNSTFNLTSTTNISTSILEPGLYSLQVTAIDIFNQSTQLTNMVQINPKDNNEDTEQSSTSFSTMTTTRSTKNYTPTRYDIRSIDLSYQVNWIVLSLLVVSIRSVIRARRKRR